MKKRKWAAAATCDRHCRKAAGTRQYVSKKTLLRALRTDAQSIFVPERRCFVLIYQCQSNVRAGNVRQRLFNVWCAYMHWRAETCWHMLSSAWRQRHLSVSTAARVSFNILKERTTSTYPANENICRSSSVALLATSCCGWCMAALSAWSGDEGEEGRRRKSGEDAKRNQKQQAWQMQSGAASARNLKKTSKATPYQPLAAKQGAAGIFSAEVNFGINIICTWLAIACMPPLCISRER